MYALKFTFSRMLIVLVIGLPVLLGMNEAYAQNPDCEITEEQGQGYTTGIQSVVDNGNNSYTIVLDIKHDGCAGGCKSMAHYAVEADAGTYSDVFVTLIEGSFNYQNIELGPDLGGYDFQGFRLTGTAGFGGGVPGEFTITYTLTGDLQDQQTVVKAGKKALTVYFTAADFDAVLNCDNSNIFPYYPPPEGGKLINSIIGPELTSIYYTSLYYEVVSDDIFQIIHEDQDYVLIKVFALGATELPLLETELLNVGLVNDPAPESDLEDYNIVVGQLAIVGWFPIANLLAIDALGPLDGGPANYARPEYPPRVNTGYIQSQGDNAMRSEVSRSIFGLTGAGVKIGVLSDSYNTLPDNQAQSDILNDDLPGGLDTDDYPVPVQVLKDFPVQASDEGRAMLQLIHDVAPGAELAFRTGFISEYDFSQGIYELRNAGCDILVDDITHITEPFYRDGIIAQAIDDVVAGSDGFDPVAYFVAAGNFGEKSYENIFDPVPTTIEGTTGWAHNYSGQVPGDITQELRVYEGNYIIVLQWDDEFGSASRDLDIYLAKNEQSTLFGFNRNNIGGNPIEVLPFTVGPTPEGDPPTLTNIIVINETDDQPVKFKYVVFRGELNADQQWEYEGLNKSTIVGHANSASAITIGAMGYNNFPGGTLEEAMKVEPFSSHGGTEVFVDGAWVSRAKPDVVGPDGGWTSLNLGLTEYESIPDGSGGTVEVPRYPFYGTSAAAPHVAAVGALVKQAYQKFYAADLDPSGLKDILTENATPVSGSDPFESGAGFVLADKALLSLANPTPIISGLTYDPDLIPGVVVVEVILEGQYVDPGAIIFANGVPLESEPIYEIEGDPTSPIIGISGIIPIDEDGSLDPEDLYPVITVWNPAISPEENDGGFSNPLEWVAKPTIQVTILPKEKVYGENFTPFTALYEMVNGGVSTPLTESDLASIDGAWNRIMDIGFGIPVSPILDENGDQVTDGSGNPLYEDPRIYNVGNYKIFANPTDYLNAENVLPAEYVPTDTENQLLDQYNIVVTQGDLVVEKLDVSITPQSASFIYGDLITSDDLSFDLTYDSELFSLDETIANAIRAQYSTGLANVMVRSTGLANALNTAAASSTGLANVNSYMISNNALNAIGIDPIDPTTYVDLDLTFDNTVFDNLDYNPDGIDWVDATITNGKNISVASSTGLANARSTVTASSTGLANGLYAAAAGSTGLANGYYLPAGSTGLANGLYAAAAGSTGLANGNSTGLANGTTINGNSNTDVILIFYTDPSVDDDLDLIEADGVAGDINMVSVHTVTSTDAGTHWIVPGVFLSSNINVSYDASKVLEIAPLSVEVNFNPESLTQTYDGTVRNAEASAIAIDGSFLNLEYKYYNASGTLMESVPVEAGSYTVTATIVEDNYTGNSGEAIAMTISKAEVVVTFNAESLTQTYDGTARNALASASGVGGVPLNLEYTYFNADGPMSGAPIEAGSYTVTATIAEANYFGNSGEAIAMTIEQAEVVVTFDAASLAQTYDGTARNALASAAGVGGVPLNLGYTYFNADGPMSGAAIEAGSYTVTATVIEDNYIGDASAEMVVDPATIIVTADPKTKVYGETDPALTYQVTSGALVEGDGFSGSLIRVSGENVGTYAISNDNLTAGGNYSLTVNTGTFTITSAPLTLSITPEVQFIFEGDPLPEFSYSFDIFGFDVSQLSGLSYAFDPSNTSKAGVFQVVPQASSQNYEITLVNGTLYINPSGPGTKHIVPKVICVDPISGGEWDYMATFEYTNNNNDPVYIPIGEDNVITSATTTGNPYHVDDQPEVFEPGVHTFQVEFDGNDLTWTVASYNHKGQKAAQGSSASASSPSCSKDAEVGEDDLGLDIESITAYPNPTSDKVVLNLNGNTLSADDISVYDIMGNQIPVGEIKPTGYNMLVDLTGQQSGVYFIRVNLESGGEMIRVIKQ